MTAAIICQDLEGFRAKRVEDSAHLAALAQGQTRRHLVRGEAEDEGHNGARQVGVEHRLERAEAGRLGFGVRGLLGVELLGHLLDAVLRNRTGEAGSE